MPSELTVRAFKVEGLHFEAHAREHKLNLDYSLDPAVGAKSGATPLETVMAALAACSANTLNLLFRQQELDVTVDGVSTRGERRDDHPTTLTRIEIDFLLRGDQNTPAQAIDGVLKAASEQFCPVWIMLKPSAEISARYRFEK